METHGNIANVFYHAKVQIVPATKPFYENPIKLTLIETKLVAINRITLFAE